MIFAIAGLGAGVLAIAAVGGIAAYARRQTRIHAGMRRIAEGGIVRSSHAARAGFGTDSGPEKFIPGSLERRVRNDEIIAEANRRLGR